MCSSRQLPLAPVYGECGVEAGSHFKEVLEEEWARELELQEELKREFEQRRVGMEGWRERVLAAASSARGLP